MGFFGFYEEWLARCSTKTDSVRKLPRKIASRITNSCFSAFMEGSKRWVTRFSWKTIRLLLACTNRIPYRVSKFPFMLQIFVPPSITFDSHKSCRSCIQSNRIQETLPLGQDTCDNCRSRNLQIPRNTVLLSTSTP